MDRIASQQFNIGMNGVKMSILTLAFLRRLLVYCLLCVEGFCALSNGRWKLVLPSPVSALGENEAALPPPPPPSSLLFI